MREPGEELAGHPDRLRWNARYAEGAGASFVPHPLAVRALSVPPPDGPVADLASGPSGAALLAAGAGRKVTAVDISDVALSLLGAECARRGLCDQIIPVQADLREWRPAGACYVLVLCTGYWDRAVFATAMTAVAPGGLLGWEAFTAEARHARPGLCPQWCLADGEPASLLGAGFEILDVRELPDSQRGAKRAMLARRHAMPSRARAPGPRTRSARTGVAPGWGPAGEAHPRSAPQAKKRVSCCVGSARLFTPRAAAPTAGSAAARA